MKCHLVLKRTCELSRLEKEQFCLLFARVFPGTLSLAEFDRKYLCTPLGYSHHGLMLADDALIGAYNLIPYTYNYFGMPVLFGLSVDLMIAEDHRGGPFNLLRMAMMAESAVARDGVAFVFGFPNQNAYEFTRRVLGWADIGRLNFYVLPWNIGAVVPRLGWSNVLSRTAVRGILSVPRLTRQTRGDFAIEKASDACFNRHRYDGQHNLIRLHGDGTCVYRICREDERMRVAFLIDVMPLTPKCFTAAVRAVHRAAAHHADVLLYVGRLPFRPGGCLRVPSRWEPRRIRMCGKILRREMVDERVLDIANWNVNLSNFDVR